MPVPDFQTLMLPLLQELRHTPSRRTSELIEAMVRDFDLSQEEREERLPSGRSKTLNNRVGWALTHMRKAGLVESLGRGVVRLTDRGRDLLGRSPQRVDMGTLQQFSEYRTFRDGALEPTDAPPVGPVKTLPPEATPEELLERSYETLRRSLAAELLDQAKKCSPEFFEQLVVELLVKMGYGGTLQDAGEAVGRSGDGGVDGIIKEDRLGLDVIYVQAKRWEGTVGRPVVQGFAGSLMGFGARKGVLLTTSTFSREALEYASTIKEPKIVLVDGTRLAELMINHDLGVSEVSTYRIKAVDSDYFAEA